MWMLIVTLRSLRRQLRRTVLTAATIAAATFIFCVLVSVPASMDRIVSDAAKGLRLVVTAPNAYKLPVRYRDVIKRLPHVTGCTAELEWDAIYQDPRDPIMTYCVDADVGTVFTDADYQVAPGEVQKLLVNRQAALIGWLLMREHHWRIGQPVTLRNSDSRIRITIIPTVVIPNQHTPNAFVIRRELLDEAVKGTYGADITDRANFLVVRVDRPENIPLVINEIDENFHNSEAETQTMTEADAIANNISAVGELRPIVISLCIAVLLTVLLVAANSMAMMVRDRINEVAVMRALGFGRGHIATLLIGEAAAIGLCGGAIGAFAAWWRFGDGATFAAAVGRTGYMQVVPAFAVGALLVAVAISIVSAILPVLEAVRIEPAAAFRRIV